MAPKLVAAAKWTIVLLVVAYQASICGRYLNQQSQKQAGSDSKCSKFAALLGLCQSKAKASSYNKQFVGAAVQSAADPAIPERLSLSLSQVASMETSDYDALFSYDTVNVTLPAPPQPSHMRSKPTAWAAPHGHDATTSPVSPDLLSAEQQVKEPKAQHAPELASMEVKAVFDKVNPAHVANIESVTQPKEKPLPQAPGPPRRASAPPPMPFASLSPVQVTWDDEQTVHMAFDVNAMDVHVHVEVDEAHFVTAIVVATLLLAIVPYVVLGVLGGPLVLPAPVVGHGAYYPYAEQNPKPGHYWLDPKPGKEATAKDAPSRSPSDDLMNQPDQEAVQRQQQQVAC